MGGVAKKKRPNTMVESKGSVARISNRKKRRAMDDDVVVRGHHKEGNAG